MRPITKSALAFFLTLSAIACDKSVTASSSGRKLELTKPSNQSLRRGETEEVAVVIGREKFTGPVKVTFQRLPRGVTVVEAKDIAADQTRAVYTLHAATDADLVENNESSVTVEGPEALTATQTFLISVKDKK